MAEVKLNGLYKVVVTEYEAGWGQRIDHNDTKFFTTLEEAQAYKKRCDRGTYQCYWRAEITQIS